MVCFSCGKYDYVKELCLSVVSTPVLGSSVGVTVEVSGLADGDFSGETDAGKKDAFGRILMLGLAPKGTWVQLWIWAVGVRLVIGLLLGSTHTRVADTRLVGLEKGRPNGPMEFGIGIAEAMSSMANLINSQVGADVIGGSVDGQMNGIGSVYA
ncbi:hypothetical protein GOBAR_AA16134 [Gossypium barbadense]|uniref:Uncharacterized protein n=1 Tax=Gossypium barbadense TaxID=3634 RepID=A0A2P5XMF0_GOSBA|nr:hypothetical protein GOBAR_AA16134 [Gossypium barbadense]